MGRHRKRIIPFWVALKWAFTSREVWALELWLQEAKTKRTVAELEKEYGNMEHMD
jgi:hypothetical protein